MSRRTSTIEPQTTGSQKKHEYEEQHKTGLKSSNIKRQVTMLQMDVDIPNIYFDWGNNIYYRANF